MTSASTVLAALPYVATFLAFFCRTAAFLATAPFFNLRVLPLRMRAAFAVFFALAMASARGAVDLSALPALVSSELILGAACGLGARIVIAGIEAGGELIGLHLGLGFAATVDPSTQTPSVATQGLIGAIAGIAFFAADGPTSVFQALAAPLPGSVSVADLMGILITRSGDVLVSAVRFAGPVMLATLISNVAFALASRAAPALNVFSVSFAGTMLVGGLALLATRSGFGQELYSTLGRVDDVVWQLVGR